MNSLNIFKRLRRLNFAPFWLKNAYSWFNREDYERLKKRVIEIWSQAVVDDLHNVVTLFTTISQKAWFEIDTPQQTIDQAVRLVLRYDAVKNPHTPLNYRLALRLGFHAPALRKRVLWLILSFLTASATILILHWILPWFPLHWFPIVFLSLIYLLGVFTFAGRRLFPYIQIITSDQAAREHMFHAYLSQLHRQATALLHSKPMRKVEQINIALHSIGYHQRSVETVREKLDKSQPQEAKPSLHDNNQQAQPPPSDNYLDAVWASFIRQYLPKVTYITPDFELQENVELHVFRIPGAPASEFIKREEIIESLVGKRIFRIHADYQGEIGVTCVELVTGILPALITYEETPTPNEPNLITLGKDVKSNLQFWDYSDQPHLLCVGITKSGKSATINNIVRQMKDRPVLMLFIDFKQLEFYPFDRQGYTVIEEAEGFPEFSELLVEEMNQRYAFLKQNGFKNYDGYLIAHERLGLPFFPRIVVFVDEVATVTGHSNPEIQKASIRNLELLLAKSRAAGFSLVISTQRPDVRSLGSGSVRDNIAVKMSSYLSPAASTMIFGDDRASRKIPNQAYSGIFLASGLGQHDDVIFRVPYKPDSEFLEDVSNWPMNPFKDYPLGSFLKPNTLVKPVETPKNYNDIF